MSQLEIYRHTLAYALAIAGSKRALASALNVTMPQLDNWLEGVATVPERVFLDTIDVVVAASPDEIARSRCLLNLEVGERTPPVVASPQARC